MPTLTQAGVYDWRSNPATGLATCLTCWGVCFPLNIRSAGTIVGRLLKGMFPAGHQQIAPGIASIRVAKVQFARFPKRGSR